MTATPVSRRIKLATGLTYHLLEWGGDDAALTHTVVLVHGFLDYAHTWEDTVAAGLGGRFHLVAPDLRGHGDSDRVGAGGYYHFMDYLADLHEVIAQLGRQRVSLVGHSMGGSVVGYYAGSFPARIHRLAMLEGLGPPEPEQVSFPERVRTWLDAWARVQKLPPRRYKSLADLLEAKEINEGVYQPYADAVCRLPAERGRVASWPVATVLPFLAQPDRHILLKPEITKQVADSLGFELNYRPEPNWRTYRSLLQMAEIYKQKLAPLKPRDLIDVQSFFWVACGGYDK